MGELEEWSDYLYRRDFNTYYVCVFVSANLQNGWTDFDGT